MEEMREQLACMSHKGDKMEEEVEQLTCMSHKGGTMEENAESREEKRDMNKSLKA